ncbi:hypothetical protein RRF57_005135 [Xylaria bambusicola]|uniref:Uncharacterized protein n=1 Tax=Xylaria bambusicola TaxID=326684 RepID=A0AAN7Z937_9PEZI
MGSSCLPSSVSARPAKPGRSGLRFCVGLLDSSVLFSVEESLAGGKSVKRASHSSLLGGVGFLADPAVVEVFATGVALAVPVEVVDTFPKS